MTAQSRGRCGENQDLFPHGRRPHLTGLHRDELRRGGGRLTSHLTVPAINLVGDRLRDALDLRVG